MGAKMRGSRDGDRSARGPDMCLACLFMNLVDLLKATVVLGLSAFLVYSVPAVSQAVFIGLFSLLWLAYAYKTMARLLRW